MRLRRAPLLLLPLTSEFIEKMVLLYKRDAAIHQQQHRSDKDSGQHLRKNFIEFDSTPKINILGV